MNCQGYTSLILPVLKTADCSPECQQSLWYQNWANSLSHFYKPTTFTVDDNIQQFSLPSSFAGRPYYNSFNV